jgi:flavin reductase (DIM6/NTAB) family NADH-FMN oxidoreductase RutF
MSIDGRQLRNALGHFATGVCIVTASTESGPIGLTINSFASVSLDPPLVLWSLDRASDRAEAFHIAEQFAINVLPEEMKDLSNRLAQKGAHAIPDELLEKEPHGVPVISGALARFVCRVETRHDGGDHVIFIGRVEEFTHVHEGRPLLYYRGAYRSLADVAGA